MPVRNVRNSGNNIIGHFASLKEGRSVAFESLIERDYLYLLDHDLNVISFEEQPLTIEYLFMGRLLHYTPDFRVVRRDGKWLIECKPANKVHTEENKHKFNAAQRWADAHDYIFEVVTDEQIRAGYYLRNIKLLTQFARHSVNAALQKRVCDILAELAEPIPLADLAALVNPSKPAAATSILFSLAYHHIIEIALHDAAISGDSLVVRRAR